LDRDFHPELSNMLGTQQEPRKALRGFFYRDTLGTGSGTSPARTRR
jgi:hypothetical protein